MANFTINGTTYNAETGNSVQKESGNQGLATINGTTYDLDKVSEITEEQEKEKEAFQNNLINDAPLSAGLMKSVTQDDPEMFAEDYMPGVESLTFDDEPIEPEPIGDFISSSEDKDYSYFEKAGGFLRENTPAFADVLLGEGSQTPKPESQTIPQAVDRFLEEEGFLGFFAGGVDKMMGVSPRGRRRGFFDRYDTFKQQGRSDEEASKRAYLEVFAGKAPVSGSFSERKNQIEEQQKKLAELRKDYSADEQEALTNIESTETVFAGLDVLDIATAGTVGTALGTTGDISKGFRRAARTTNKTNAEKALKPSLDSLSKEKSDEFLQKAIVSNDEESIARAYTTALEDDILAGKGKTSQKKNVLTGIQARRFENDFNEAGAQVISELEIASTGGELPSYISRETSDSNVLQNVADQLRRGEKVEGSEQQQIIEDISEEIFRRTDPTIADDETLATIQKRFDKLPQESSRQKVGKSVVSKLRQFQEASKSVPGEKQIPRVQRLVDEGNASRSNSTKNTIESNIVKDKLTPEIRRYIEDLERGKKRTRDVQKGRREGAQAQKKSTRKKQNALVKLVEKNLPLAERGKYITKIRDATTDFQLEKAAQSVSAAGRKAAARKTIRKAAGKKKSKIAFLRKQAGFNQTAMNDIRKAAGVDVPLSKASNQQLDAIIQELQRRKQFLQKNNFLEPQNQKSKPVTEQMAAQNRAQVKNRPGWFRRAVTGLRSPQILKKGGESADFILTPISTRLANIDPSLRKFLYEYESAHKLRAVDYRKRTRPFTDQVKKMDRNDIIDLDFYLKNGAREKTLSLVRTYGFEDEYLEVEKVLDDLYKQANDAGLEIGYLKGYFPRLVKDTEGLQEYTQKQLGDEWSNVQQAFVNYQKKFGVVPSEEQKAEIINTLIRGFETQGISLTNSGALKSRKIDQITAELNEFYHDSFSSLDNYIGEISELVERRKLFGQMAKQDGTLDDATEYFGGNASVGDATNYIKSSYGARINQLIIDGKISPEQESEIRNIFQARFSPNRMNAFFRSSKNVTYILTLGNFEAALTQVKDLGNSMYQNGIIRSAAQAPRALVGKNEIDITDLGLEKPTAEMTDAYEKSQRALEWSLKWSLFKNVDKLGRNTFVNASWKKHQKMVQKNDPETLAKIRDISENEADQVIDDIRNGRITGEVKRILFGDILGYYPNALSEMPEAYLKSDNARIFYTLQSFTLKRLDIIRREIFQEIYNNPAQGMKNLVRFGGIMTASGMTVETVKDFITGEGFDIEQIAAEEIWNTTGLSRYDMETAFSSGAGGALADLISPTSLTIPLDTVPKLFSIPREIISGDDQTREKALTEGMEYVPVLGEILPTFLWATGGIENYKERARKDQDFWDRLVPGSFSEESENEFSF